MNGTYPGIIKGAFKRSTYDITVRRFARFKVGDPNWTVATTKMVEGTSAE